MNDKRIRTAHRNATPEPFRPETPGCSLADEVLRIPVRSSFSGRTVQMWVAKHALTKGIFRVAGEMRSDGWFTPDDRSVALRVGKDCFASRQDAIRRGEALRDQRIRRLKSEIRKLEKQATSVVPARSRCGGSMVNGAA